VTERPLVRRGDRWLRPGPATGGPRPQAPQAPLTTARRPDLLLRGATLTDGHGNGFTIVDAVVRGGTRWFRLRNTEMPDLELHPRDDGARRRVWFSREELIEADLAYVRGEVRARREGW